MTDLQTARDDLSFLRGLAEQARDAPPVGGSMTALAGTLFGIASLVAYLETAQAIELPGTGLGWLVAGLVYGVAGTALMRQLKSCAGAASARNQATGAAWFAIALAIIGVVAVCGIAAVRTAEPVVMGLIAPVILVLYGLGWTVAAMLSPEGWLRAVAASAFGSALTAAWYAGTAEQYLVNAAALVLTAVLPGLRLMRRARA